jgi:hypothetical protein
MGTRSLTVIKDEEGGEICVMYRQFDGYLEGHGKDLLEFLQGRKVVNGISLGSREKASNGMACLAASLIANFKTAPLSPIDPAAPATDIGNVYLHRAGTRDCGEAYIYTVRLKRFPVDQEEPGGAIGKLHLTIRGSYPRPNGILLYEGPVDELDIEKLVEQIKKESDVEEE